VAGGMYARRGPGPPLGARATASQSNPEQAFTAAPCWLVSGPDAVEPVPGAVLAWRRDSAGKWQALVAAWVDAERVRQRQESAAQDQGQASG
jgi:hypothetical protein